jgi:hypothetical protein
MIVTNAHIQMTARQEYHQEYSLQEEVSIARRVIEPVTLEAVPKPLESVQVDLSRAGSLLAKYQETSTVDLSAELDPQSRLNLRILRAMFEALTGQSLDLKEPKELLNEDGPRELQITSLPARSLRAGEALVYKRQERYEEHERMQFQTQGIIRTQDGREISFNVDLAMSRDFVQESSLQIQQGQMIDPLVINFDGAGAQLSQTRFSFDLDNDGTEEQIASLRPGSGFLALDRNGDGVINNGSELFGPTSGRGFAELAQFDEDGNNFIDEGDSIYHQLRIWIQNEDGSSQLVALGDKNIGAIFLGHVSSPFQLKDENNNSLGEIVNSGIYLKETGEVGVVQELNLRV